MTGRYAFWIHYCIKWWLWKQCKILLCIWLSMSIWNPHLVQIYIFNETVVLRWTTQACLRSAQVRPPPGLHHPKPGTSSGEIIHVLGRIWLWVNGRHGSRYSLQLKSLGHDWVNYINYMRLQSAIRPCTPKQVQSVEKWRLGIPLELSSKLNKLDHHEHFVVSTVNTSNNFSCWCIFLEVLAAVALQLLTGILLCSRCSVSYFRVWFPDFSKEIDPV